MPLIVEHGQCPQNGGQALARDEHCRRGGAGRRGQRPVATTSPAPSTHTLHHRPLPPHWGPGSRGGGLGAGPQGSQRLGRRACSCPGPWRGWAAAQCRDCYSHPDSPRAPPPRLRGPWPSHNSDTCAHSSSPTSQNVHTALPVDTPLALPGSPLLLSASHPAGASSQLRIPLPGSPP